jgi:hypothetical protein
MVRCDLGALANHATAGATIVGRPTQRTTLSNQVLAGANQADPNPLDNAAAIKTVVR